MLSLPDPATILTFFTLLLFLTAHSRSDENPDVLNEGAINRGQIQMSTGMEKEEEGEVHIAKAMASKNRWRPQVCQQTKMHIFSSAL